MATFKDFISKQLLGYTQRDLSRQMGNLVNQNLYSFLGADYQVNISDNFDYIRDGYMKVPYAYEAITMITNKIKSSPPLIYQVKNATALKQYENIKWSTNPADILKANKLKAEALEEVDEKRIKDLLKRPNEKQSWDEFLGLMCVLLLSTGNALVYGVSADGRSKKKTEMWALPFSPLDYSIISDGIFEPIKEYRINSNLGFDKPFPAKDIAHFKTVNPLWETSGGQLFGMSPLQAYRHKLNRAPVSEEATTKLIKNGFRMSFVSPKNTQDAWDAAQLQGMKEAIQRALSSRESFARFIPATAGVDVIPVGMDSTEIGLSDQDKLDREGVYRAYQINPLLASTDKSSYNNIREVRKAFIHDAVAPWCELISDMLTMFICEPFRTTDGKEYIIKLDYLSLPELGADMKELTEWLNNAPVTPNEFRSMIGFSEVKDLGADMIMLKRDKVSLEQVANGTATGLGNGEGAN